MSEEVLKISPEDLSLDAVEGLIDAFLTRQGHMPEDLDTLPIIRKQVLDEIQAGRLHILWDPYEQSSNIVSSVELQKIQSIHK